MDERHSLDRQLYEIRGEGYCLPVWVEGMKKVYKTRIFVVLNHLLHLTPRMQKTAEETLDTFGTRIKAKSGYFSNTWTVDLESASMFLSKSIHEDPEDVLVWNSAQASPLKAPESEKEWGDFATAYCNSKFAYVKSVQEVQILWASLCRFANEWMLLKNRSLDLGFVTLHALPFRMDWLGRASNALQYDWSDKKNVNLYAASSHFGTLKKNFRRLLLNGFFSCLESGGEVVRWSITAIPSERFYSIAQSVEKKRGGAYMSAYLSKIRDHSYGFFKVAYEIFHTYSSEADRPFLRFPEILKERVINTQLDKLLKEHLCDEPVLANAPVEKSEQASVDSEGEDLQPVPDLQPTSEDVRNAGDTLGQSEDGVAGTDGMPVFHAMEGQGGGELLAGESTGRNDAVDPLAGRVEQLPDQTGNSAV